MSPVRPLASASVVFAALGLMGLGPAPGDPWRPLDPDNTLVIDTSQGRMVVEMRPDFAPLAVARVRLLAREGVYDGLLFHRVIENFVDQTGNPNNRDGGVSTHPDLPAEFSFRIAPGAFVKVRQASDGQEGFLGASPIGTPAPTERNRAPAAPIRAWGAYCPGVAGMGRQADPGTGNSEIFFMRAASRRLDHDYSVWGKVIWGLDVVRAEAVGEPPAHPDRMLKVRVMSDLPAADRPKLQVMDEHSRAFARRVARVRAQKGADFTVCDVEVPVRIRPHP
jgi:peptidylprolyl isomerase